MHLAQVYSRSHRHWKIENDCPDPPRHCKALAEKLTSSETVAGETKDAESSSGYLTILESAWTFWNWEVVEETTLGP